MNRWEVVHGIRVDMDAVFGIDHAFSPERCAGGGSSCCCDRYEVGLERGEVDRLVDWTPLAAAFQPGLTRDPFPFEESEDGWVIETESDGVCPFLYRNADGCALCSLHSAALEQGEDPYRIKPRACALWPLALGEGRVPVLSVMEDSFHFPCNRRRRAGCRHLSPGISDLVDRGFGREFRMGLAAVRRNPSKM